MQTNAVHPLLQLIQNKDYATAIDFLLSSDDTQLSELLDNREFPQVLHEVIPHAEVCCLFLFAIGGFVETIVVRGDVLL